MGEELPPGPAQRFGTTDDLSQWLAVHRKCYGDIYRASVVGEPAARERTIVNVTRDVSTAVLKITLLRAAELVAPVGRRMDGVVFGIRRRTIGLSSWPGGTARSNPSCPGAARYGDATAGAAEMNAGSRVK
jgi:hypothetical protein